jgi:hypothetical protein
MTPLLNPQYSNFTIVQKLRNVFIEVFLVQIRQKFWKIRFEFGKCVPNFKKKGKKGNSREKKRCGGGREIIFLVDLSLEGPKSLLRVTIIDLGFELKKNSYRVIKKKISLPTPHVSFIPPNVRFCPCTVS